MLDRVRNVLRDLQTSPLAIGLCLNFHINCCDFRLRVLVLHRLAELGRISDFSIGEFPIRSKRRIKSSFYLGGYVNKQNCRIWSTENPRAYIEKPMHPKRVTVWCGFWSWGIIGPMSKERLLQSMAIVIGPCWTNFHSQKLKRGGYWQHLVSTGRRYVPHSRS